MQEKKLKDLTLSELKDLYYEYFNGESLVALARRFNQKHETLAGYFKRNNLPLKDKAQVEYEKWEKHAKTCLEKYGVENPSHSKEIVEKRKQTTLEHFGVTCSLHAKPVMDKCKETWQNKYGVEHFAKAQEIKDKRKQTCLNKYNVENPSQVEAFKEKREDTFEEEFGGNPFSNEEVKEKIKQAHIKNLGVDHPMKNPAIVEKGRNTHFEKTGFYNPMDVEETKEKIKNTFDKLYGGHPNKRPDVILNIKRKQWEKALPIIFNRLKNHNYELLDAYDGIHISLNGKHLEYKKYNIKHTLCGNIFLDDVFSMPRCPVCFPNPNCSQPELLFRQYIEGITNKKFNKNNGLIKNPLTNRFLELDMLNEDFKIAFEFNGIFYHCKVEKNYHSLKTALCSEKGIKLYHIWDHYNTDVLKSRISSIFNKYDKSFEARKLKFKQISPKEANVFFLNNHLQGAAQASLAFGLYDNELLVSALSYRKAADKNIIEIARFCSLPFSKVIGGFSKLFVNSLNYLKDYDSIITYADKDWTPNWQDAVYHKCGFSFIEDTGPSMFYYDTAKHKIYNRLHFQKYKLKEKFPDVYDENLTEQQILAAKNIYPVYNSGNWKFAWRLGTNKKGERAEAPSP